MLGNECKKGECNMKFVHIADMHFDTSFTTLTNKANLGDVRRLDQRLAFNKIIEYIKENEIPYLFISGDFYEHEYIRLSTIEYINNLFTEIPDTQIFISPGNHDPYTKNSYYNQLLSLLADSSSFSTILFFLKIYYFYIQQFLQASQLLF